MNSIIEGFMSLFDWAYPKYNNYEEFSEQLDEKMQDLYDKMGWGIYENPLKKNN